ncbi:MAG: thiol:disulfide interchange protein DsbG [Gammaproteobacteria bacterium]|nr:thiol:disulfide interchange protein DsbG [Gammaproteobacteria bacterium]
MRKTILTIFITAIICIASCAGLYWWYIAPNSASAPQLISQISHSNLTVLSQFNAIGNLEGYVVQSTQNNTQSIIYMDNQQRYLISGTIIAADGTDISAQNEQTYITPKSASLAFNYIANVTYIQQGSSKAAHQAYILFDPNCIYCHRLFEALQPAIQSGILAIRWIPVAFLKESSAGRAYAILSSPNPLAMLLQNETNFNESSEDGGTPPLNSPSLKVQQQLKNNMAFLTETQLTTTPAILYKSQTGIANIIPGLLSQDKLNAMIEGFSVCF